MRFFFSLITLLTLISAASVSSARSRRAIRHVKVIADSARVEPPAAPAIVLDTIPALPADITRAGYDKPLRSNRETLFLTNNTDRYVRAVCLDITYLDSDSRTLHSRHLWLNISLAPHATAMASFRSWDVQQSFYYHKSNHPRRAVASPYSVTTAIDSIAVMPAAGQ